MIQEDLDTQPHESFGPSNPESDDFKYVNH